MVTETEKNKKIKSVQDQILQYVTFTKFKFRHILTEKSHNFRFPNCPLFQIFAQKDFKWK